MFAVLLNFAELLKSCVNKGSPVIFAVKSVMVKLMTEAIWGEKGEIPGDVFFEDHQRSQPCCPRKRKLGH